MFEHLKWLSSAIDSEEEVSITDLTNGFPLLQVLSLISPASVDLSWNTTPEAQECPNISLRNYISLTKGLKYLEQNPPSDMSPNEEGVKKLKATISAMSQTVIHDAKSGQIEACVEILKNMRNVWKIAKVDQLQCSEEVLAEPERVTAYFPSCKSFLPMVRWLLHKTIVSLRNSNFDQILSEELEKALEMCSHTSKSIPSTVITILSNCHIYNYLNYLLLEGDSFQFPTSFINNGQNAATTPLIFWDNLNSLGILNLDESMRNSFKEMQRDKKTFYESIHSKIIAAFIQSESSLEIEVVVDYLDRAFANFDKGVTFPYDMEDAYLIWMNCCLEELKQDLDFNIDSDIPEYEELNTAVEDAWLIALTLGNYTIDDKLVLTEICKELVCKSNLSPLERNKNNRIFEKISVLSSKNTGIFIPWLPHETQKQDGKNNFYSANYTNLMMASLHDLMKWILSWEKGFLNRIVVAQDKFDDLDLGQESVVSLERFIEIIDRPKNEAEYEACNSGSYSPGEEKRKANAIENNKVGEQIDEASALDYEEYEDDREFANNFLEEYYSECQTAQNAEDVNRLDQAKDCGEDKYGDLLLDDQDDFCNTLQRSIQLLNESTQYADVEPRKPRVLVTQAGRRQKSITARFQRHSVDQCEPLRGTACIDLKLQSSAEKLKAPIKLVTAEPFSSFPPNALSGAKGFDSAVDLSFKNTKDVVEFTTLSNAEENENSTNEAREDFEFLPLKSQKCKQNTLSSFQAVDFYSAADFDFLELYGPEAYKEGVCLSMPIPQTEEIQIQEQESNEIFEYEDSNYEYSEKSCKDKIPVHEKEVIAAPHCTVQYQFQEMIRQQSIILFEEERQEAESDAQDHGIIQEPSSNPPRLQISSTPRSRPRTGLLSYPIPETEEELVSVVQLFDDKWARPNDEKAFTTKNLTSAMTKLTDNLPNLEESRRDKSAGAKVAKKGTEIDLLQKKKLQAEAHENYLKTEEQRRKSYPKVVRPSTSSYQKLNLVTANTKKSRSLFPAKSNKIIIKNALMHVSLAGKLNQARSSEVLQDLAESKAGHFVILFREVNNFSFRGLYFWDHTLDQTLKLYSGCLGPTEIDPSAVLEFYKYDSGARTFRRIPTKSFGKSVDAVAIGRNYFLPQS